MFIKRKRSISSGGKRSKRFRSGSRSGRGRFIRGYGKFSKRRSFARKVRRIMYAADEKHRWTHYFNTSVDATGFVWPLINANGNGENMESYNNIEATWPTRDGHRIMPRNLYINGILSYGDATNLVRILVVRCPTNSGVLTIANLPNIVYQGPSVAIPLLWAPYNRLNVPSKYNVLYDKKFFLNSINRPHFRVKINLKKHLRQVEYSGDISSSWTKNQIYMFVISDSGAAPHVSFTGLISMIHTNI